MAGLLAPMILLECCYSLKVLVVIIVLAGCYFFSSSGSGSSSVLKTIPRPMSSASSSVLNTKPLRSSVAFVSSEFEAGATSATLLNLVGIYEGAVAAA